MSSPPRLPPGLRVFERGWLSSNNILLIGAERSALVDSGYVTHAPQTLALVRHALRGRPLDDLFNTHLHSDHCGGNAALQREYACRTTIPAGEADVVRHWDQQALSFSATGQQCPRFGFDATLAPGMTVEMGDLPWQVLGAPGHNPHSLMFFCAEEGILISADALWENGFGVIFPELLGASGFAEARATLELIAGLDVRLVIPGHGRIFTCVDAALERAFSRLDHFAAEPARNAQNAVKVLVKFLLLERQAIALADLPRLLGETPLFLAASRQMSQGTVQELADWTLAQLLRTGAARLEGGYLVNEN